MKIRKWITFIALFGVMISLSGCSRLTKGSSTIKIAAMSTTESSIMANMIAQLVAHDLDYKTEIISNLGSSTVVHQALVRGDADIAATRYTGTDLTGTLGMDTEKDPEKATEIVTKEFKKRYKQTWFPSYGFSDTYAFMIKSDLAKEKKINDISDLKKIATTAKVGVDSTWMNRKGDGYSSFKEIYGFDFANIYPMQIGLVYDAVETDKMQAVLGYSTDGRIKSYDLKVLEDNKQLFPPYQASMVVNDDLLEKYPKLSEVLHKLDGKISVEEMQNLNYQVDDKLLEPSVVAKNFLEAHDYFEGDN